MSSLTTEITLRGLGNRDLATLIETTRNSEVRDHAADILSERNPDKDQLEILVRRVPRLSEWAVEQILQSRYHLFAYEVCRMIKHAPQKKGQIWELFMKQNPHECDLSHIIKYENLDAEVKEWAAAQLLKLELTLMELVVIFKGVPTRREQMAERVAQEYPENKYKDIREYMFQVVGKDPPGKKRSRILTLFTKKA